MEEEVKFCIDEASEKMNKAIHHLQDELMRIRAGKATTALLDGITVDYYSVLTPLNQVSNLSTPDAKTIIIQPWDKTMIEPIEKAIMQANIGLNPVNNGELIRIVVPPLTEERRKEIVKQIKSMGENTKVSIRNARRDANEELKKLQKDGLSEDLEKDAENEVQDMTNDFTKKIDDMVESREKDIMTI
ncbi:MAG: ribosome recycling factor [Bacteroidales bacterium]|nr:MAG: ribosome recycling factor [Bacteroidales bacterium]